MASFKHKPTKLKYITNSTTLDEIHKGQIAMFEEKKNSIASKKDQLENINKQIEKMETESQLITNYTLRAKLKAEKESLEDDINGIQNNNDIMEYLSKTGNILVDYYDITAGVFYNVPNNDSQREAKIDQTDKTEKTEEQESETFMTETTDNNSDKLKLLNKMSQTKRKVKKPIKKRKILNTHANTQTQSILNYFPNENTKQKIETNVNRSTLYNEYLSLIDATYISNKNKKISMKLCTNKECNYNEKTLIQSEGILLCQKCGTVENIIIESEIPSHKDIINDKPKYPYKKQNHLKEKLNQFQSKETTTIDDSIYTKIMLELKKQRIEINKVTPIIIKSILKKHRMTEYYEHLQQIYCKITGNQPIILSREIEEKIVNMFSDMQDSFKKYCPAERSNFLNYSYVLHKLFKILNMDEYTIYFPLLKSKEVLHTQDIIWKKICSDMKWVFHHSV
jgi:hypothetical protein